MTSKIVVVQEPPPTLESLESNKVKAFLKAYKQYYLRYKKTKDTPSMKQLISANNMAVLKSLNEMDTQQMSMEDFTYDVGSDSEDEDNQQNSSSSHDQSEGVTAARPRSTTPTAAMEEYTDEICERLLIKHYGPATEEAAIKL